jgi:hypothetical protein
MIIVNLVHLVIPHSRALLCEGSIKAHGHSRWEMLIFAMTIFLMHVSLETCKCRGFGISGMIIIKKVGLSIGASRDDPSPSRDDPSPSRDDPSPSRDDPSPSRDDPSPSRGASRDDPSPSPRLVLGLLLMEQQRIVLLLL